jgi:hypothetical protein
MAVQYVRVKPIVEGFTPVVRSTGTVAILGAAPAGTDNVPVQITSTTQATEVFGAPFSGANNTTLNSPLTRALHTALAQTPGPGGLWAVRTGATLAAATPLANALAAVEALEAQFVVIAGAVLAADSAAEAGVIGQLLTHVTSVSNAGDGRERMGVVMLPPNSADPALVSGALASDRMVYVAHRNPGNADPAAAVAGTIAGYPPHVSMVLKPVAITSPPFSAADIDKLNFSEEFGNPPRGKGVNWLTSPTLLPGQGVYLGEGYTGAVGGKKFIDVQRTIDDIAFRLKARLMGAIGNVRISRAGLRVLTVQLETVLAPLVRDGVLEDFSIDIPILGLLEADPALLGPAELQEIQDAQTARSVKVLVSVDYAGNVHRIDVSFLFR